MRPLISQKSLRETADKLKRQMNYIYKDELPVSFDSTITPDKTVNEAEVTEVAMESSRVREDEECYSNARL